MILREALRSVTQRFEAASIADARAEAELLLGHVLGLSKTRLYTEPERDLTSAETEYLWWLVQRRLDHEPTAYILGHWEFYGSDFYVDSSTFIPRPETELLVEKALEAADGVFKGRSRIVIVDVGTGCGAIAICLALALPQAKVYATDISHSALQVAEANCRRHGANGQVKLLHGNLLEPLPERVDMIVANLPYIKDSEIRDLSPEVRFEPRLALSGGEDGMDKIEELLWQMPGRTKNPWCLLLEIGQGQDEMVIGLVTRYFPRATIDVALDLGGIPRVVKATMEKERSEGRNRKVGSAYRGI